LSAAGPSEQILDAPLQDVVGREADRIADAAPFHGLVERRQGERRIRPGHDRLPAPAIPIDDGQQDLVPSVSAVHVARPELGCEAVALGIEDEEWVVTHGLEMAVVRRLLLGAVDGTLGAVDIERHPLSR
jgi:hypothetical protein